MKRCSAGVKTLSVIANNPLLVVTDCCCCVSNSGEYVISSVPTAAAVFVGIVGMCKEHMGVALALKVPVFFVVTKVDICPEHVLKHTLSTLQAILKKPGVKKKPFMVHFVLTAWVCEVAGPDPCVNCEAGAYVMTGKLLESFKSNSRWQFLIIGIL